MTEQWRPWRGTGYLVSDQGRVRGLRGSILRPGLSTSGYPMVNLGKHGGTRTVHAMVAEAFIGPRPDGMQVRHLDDDKLNNRLDNLAYGTPSENRYDSVRNGTHAKTKKTECPKGHPYDEANTYVRLNGQGRGCKRCNCLRVVAYKSAQRASRRAAA